MIPTPAQSRVENFRVIDNFCPRIDDVLLSVKQAGVGTWRPPTENRETGHDEYDGMGFIGKQSLMLAALGLSIQSPIFPNRNFFRKTTHESQVAFIHSDRLDGAKTCIAYMTDNGDGSGTAFYRHRATGMTRMPSFSEMKSNGSFDAMWADMQNPSPDIWEELDFVRGLANRALIFDSPLFHARHQGRPGNPIGGTIDEGRERLVWVAHFHLPATVDAQD